MSQFDVHRNSGKNQDAIPYVVLVQSSLFDSYRRRVVVPLVRKTTLGKITNARFNPTFRIQGVTVVLHPLEIVSVPAEGLGEPVASLAGEGIRIMDALDEMLTQARE
jgi:toxin CcdB